MTAADWISWAPRLQSVLRMVAGFLFMQFGMMKTFAFPVGVPPNGGTVPLMSQVGVGGVLEMTCGALLLLGLFTRPAAFLMSGQMAVAYFQFHAPKGLWPLVNGGVDAALFCFLWLYFSAAGGGPWSIDALRRKG
jgi:putative oxidoreductase